MSKNQKTSKPISKLLRYWIYTQNKGKKFKVLYFLPSSSSRYRIVHAWPFWILGHVKIELTFIHLLFLNFQQSEGDGDSCEQNSKWLQKGEEPKRFFRGWRDFYSVWNNRFVPSSNGRRVHNWACLSMFQW